MSHRSTLINITISFVAALSLIVDVRTYGRTYGRTFLLGLLGHLGGDDLKMCDVCVKAASDLKLTFNCNKSLCIAFGPMCHFQVPDMSLGLLWQSSVNYLGLTLLIPPPQCERRYSIFQQKILSFFSFAAKCSTLRRSDIGVF